MTRPKFNIGEKVYHNTPDSDEAIVVDILYSHLLDKTTYIVSTGFGAEFECMGHELTDEKLLF